MSENLNTSEVALPVKGKFKPKRPFISFISGTRTGVRFVSNTAYLSLKELTGAFENENVNLKFTICEEGTVNIEEVDTNFCSDEMIQRFIDDIDNRNVSNYTQKYVISGLNFKSEDDYLCFLEVEEQRPIDKLASLFDELKSEKTELSNTGLSILDSLFGESDDDSNEEEVKVEETKSEEENKVDNEYINSLEESFRKMNEAKIAELQKRINKNQEEVKTLQHEIRTKEKTISDKNEEYGVLQSRLRTLQPKPTPLGIYVFVGEENKTGITPDQALVDVVKVISPILKLKEDAVIDLLTKGYFPIHFGNATDDFKITREVISKVQSIDLLGKISAVSDTQVEYRGELTWHEILERLLQVGFEQDADFDKKSGSNSYKTEETEKESNEDCCGNENCGCNLNLNNMKSFDEFNDDFDDDDFPVRTDFENFIFAVDEIDGEAWFAIQTKEHWDDEGCLDDQHQNLDLGDEWGEEMESTFSFDGHIVDGILDLLNKGLKFDPSFQNFMEQNGPYKVNGILLKDYILQNYPNSLV
jgi:hypothetical protein